MDLKYYKDKLNEILDNIKCNEMSDEQYNEWYELYDDLYYYYDELEMNDEEFNEYRLLLLTFRGVKDKYWKE